MKKILLRRLCDFLVLYIFIQLDRFPRFFPHTHTHIFMYIVDSRQKRVNLKPGVFCSGDSVAHFPLLTLEKNIAGSSKVYTTINNSPVSWGSRIN